MAVANGVNHSLKPGCVPGFFYAHFVVGCSLSMRSISRASLASFGVTLLSKLITRLPLRSIK